MPTYTAIEPAHHNTTLIIGDTWRVDFTLQDEDGTAFDLDGVTGVCRIRTEPAGAILASPTVALVAAASGQFKAELAPSDSASLAPGEYRYAIRLTWPDTTVHTVVDGIVAVLRSLV